MTNSQTVIGLLFLFFSSPCFAEQAGCLSSEPITIVIRNDDVCARSNSNWEQKILHVFIENNIAQSVGFIPQIASIRYYDPQAQYHTINQNQGILDLYRPLIKKGIIDPVQHGLTHQKNFLYAGNRTRFQGSEFSGLSKKEQKQKLLLGKQLLESHLKHDINLFIPPWNNLDNTTLTALHQAGFKGVSDKLLYRTDGLKIDMPPSRMVEFHELPEMLRHWKEEGQCMGNLEPQTIVVIYHSWAEYSDEGLQRITDSLHLIKESGIKTATLSQVFNISSH